MLGLSSVGGGSPPLIGDINDLPQLPPTRALNGTAPGPISHGAAFLPSVQGGLGRGGNEDLLEKPIHFMTLGRY